MSPEERESLLSIYSDVHKDAYGYRPRWNYHELSDVELARDIDHFQATIEQEEAFQRLAEEEAVKDWELRISGLMVDHRITRADAIRWDMQAHGIEDDVDHYAWQLGLPYGMELAS